MPSDIEKAVNEYRQLMQGREADTMRDLVKQWILIEDNLQAEMSELAYIMSAKRDAGEVITQQMLWKEEKYRRLIQQAEDRITAFTKSAESLINASQLDAYVLGVDAANGLIETQYKSIGALSPFWERTDIRGVESMSAILQQGKPLHNLLEASYPTAVDGLTTALIEGVARGFLPGQVAENMVKNFGLGADRALLIAQTEMSRAYREGTIQQYRSTPVVEYYIRMANKATACLACIILDGTKYNKSDEMSDHPRGMCNILAKVKGVPPPQWEHGEKWFKGLDEQKQRQVMGNTRFDLWKSGQVKFNQFATMSHDKVWGEAPAVLSLKSLRQRYNIFSDADSTTIIRVAGNRYIPPITTFANPSMGERVPSTAELAAIRARIANMPAGLKALEPIDDRYRTMSALRGGELQDVIMSDEFNIGIIDNLAQAKMGSAYSRTHNMYIYHEFIGTPIQDHEYIHTLTWRNKVLNNGLQRDYSPPSLFPHASYAQNKKGEQFTMVMTCYDSDVNKWASEVSRACDVDSTNAKKQVNAVINLLKGLNIW